MNNFGEKLKVIRLENELTQNDLAEMLHVTRQAISSWENKNSYPGIETLIMISQKFDISLDNLLREDDSLKNKIIKDSTKVKHPILLFIVRFVLLFVILLGLSRIIYWIGHYAMGYSMDWYFIDDIPYINLIMGVLLIGGFSLEEYISKIRV